MLEEIVDNSKNESNDKKKKNEFDNNSMKSIEGNLISRKKVKIKTLRRLNLDLPDELLHYDNDSEKVSVKPQSKNQMIESYGELTHRSMFFPKPKKIDNLKQNSTIHIENLKEMQNKLNFENFVKRENNFENINEIDNFSNKDEAKDIEKINESEEKENEEEKEKEVKEDQEKVKEQENNIFGVI